MRREALGLEAGFMLLLWAQGHFQGSFRRRWSKGGDHPPGKGPGWGVSGMGKQLLLTSLFSPKTSQERVPPS